nr:BrnA antitoxin family protein [Synechococcus elongatus]
MPEKFAATRHTSSKPDDDLPELTDEMLSRAVLKQGGKRIGRPRSQSPKVAISLRLEADVLQRWRDSGPGWQTRMAELLSKETP